MYGLFARAGDLGLVHVYHGLTNCLYEIPRCHAPSFYFLTVYHHDLDGFTGVLTIKALRKLLFFLFFSSSDIAGILHVHIILIANPHVHFT